VFAVEPDRDRFLRCTARFALRCSSTHPRRRSHQVQSPFGAKARCASFSSRSSIAGCLGTGWDAFARSDTVIGCRRMESGLRDSEITLACILRAITRAGYPWRLPSVATEVGPAGSIEGAP
jgi:hypothetical protein